jgi:hypothetical protein
VFLATAHLRADNDTPPPASETRVYDVRALIAPVPNFPLETCPHGNAFAAPPGQAPADPQSSSPQNMLFCGGSGQKPTPPPTEMEMVGSVVKLIEDTVATDTWKDNGGALGAISFFEGKLVIRQSPAALKEIEDLIAKLEAQKGPLVHVYANWLQLPAGEVDRMLLAHDLSKLEAFPSVMDPAALARLPEDARRFSGEINCTSGQTVHLICGHESTAITNATPVVSNNVVAYAPMLSEIGSGVALQINARVSSDHHDAWATIYSAYTDPRQPHPGQKAQGVATTQAASGKTVIKGEAQVQLEAVESNVQEMHATCRIPLGKSVVVGRMTLDPNTNGANSPELVLVMRIDSSK